MKFEILKSSSQRLEKSYYISGNTEPLIKVDKPSGRNYFLDRNWIVTAKIDNISSEEIDRLSVTSFRDFPLTRENSKWTLGLPSIIKNLNGNLEEECILCKAIREKIPNRLHYPINHHNMADETSWICNRLRKDLITKEGSAFVTLVMKNPSYFEGAIALAKSLRLVNTQHQLVCMITPDVSNKIPKEMDIYDRIILVDMITRKSKPMKTDRSQKLYKSWISSSYTKGNILSLIEYQRVCFLDGDMLILRNIDHLMKYDYAASFTNIWRSKHSPYKGLKEGDIVDEKMIIEGLSKEFVLNGHLIVVTPKHYYDYLKIIDKKPYGHKSFSGFDEQSLAEVSLKRWKWNFLPDTYSMIFWHSPSMLNDNVKLMSPYLVHYFGERKPWNIGKVWDDEKLWFEVRNDEEKDTCSFCEILLSKFDSYKELDVEILDKLKEQIPDKFHPFVKNKQIRCKLLV